MKKISTLIVFSLLVISSQFTAHATDLVVAAGGAGGAYSTITSALAAASPNDRVIVYPQTGGGSYSEPAITITKSVQILSASEGAYYSVDVPSITIAPATAGIKVTIIGMKLFTGGIATSITSPAGSRSVINLLNDSLAQGALSFNNDNYDVTVASCQVEGGLTFKYGKVLGNIFRSAVNVSTDASTNNPTDTVLIIGNKISHYSSVYSGGINWASTSHFFSIQNNYINLTYPISGYNYGIYVSASKASIAGTNTITNNTLIKSNAYSFYMALYTTTNATSFTEISNNLLFGPTSYSLYMGGGNYSVHYNYSSNSSNIGFTNDGTNILYTNTTINSEGLNTNPASNTINGGSTDSAYADIDLTRNDVGCYGGSYTLNNFFPISNNDWARVILVTAPRRVLINGVIPVKAIGFDK